MCIYISIYPLVFLITSFLQSKGQTEMKVLYIIWGFFFFFFFVFLLWFLFLADVMVLGTCKLCTIFTPGLLMHRVSFWSISECLNLFNRCIGVPKCEKMDLKIIVTAGKGSNMQKMQVNWRIWRTWRIVLKNSAQFNCSEQTRDSWTTKPSWIIQVTTQY